MKKLAKTVSAFALVMSLAVPTAFATTQDFSFTLAPGDLDWDGYYSKDDNEGTAYVNTTEGNLISSDKVWYKVRNKANTKYTNSDYINSYKKISLDYVQSVSSGGEWRLNAQQDSDAPYNVTVKGRWTP